MLVTFFFAYTSMYESHQDFSTQYRPFFGEILSNSIVLFLAVLVFLGDLFLANLYVQNVCFFYYYMPICNIYILHITLRLLPRILWVRKFEHLKLITYQD